MQEALLGGLSPQEFLRRHWQKRPLLVRRALPGFRGVVGRNELFALAARSEVESRLVERSGRRWRVALLGAGKIGSALIEHHGFRERGFDIVAVFDNDSRKVGTAWNGLTVHDESGLEAELRRAPVEIAILAVPADAAQPLADRLAGLGVTAILNVAPVQLVVPPEVEVKTVSLAMELEALSFALTNR